MTIEQTKAGQRFTAYGRCYVRSRSKLLSAYQDGQLVYLACNTPVKLEPCRSPLQRIEVSCTKRPGYPVDLAERNLRSVLRPIGTEGSLVIKVEPLKESP